jgi:hypothetical protein
VNSLSNAPNSARSFDSSAPQRRPVTPFRLRGFTITSVRADTGAWYWNRREDEAFESQSDSNAAAEASAAQRPMRRQAALLDAAVAFRADAADATIW